MTSDVFCAVIVETLARKISYELVFRPSMIQFDPVTVGNYKRQQERINKNVMFFIMECFRILHSSSVTLRFSSQTAASSIFVQSSYPTHLHFRKPFKFLRNCFISCLSHTNKLCSRLESNRGTSKMTKNTFSCNRWYAYLMDYVHVSFRQGVVFKKMILGWTKLKAGFLKPEKIDEIECNVNSSYLCVLGNMAQFGSL